MSGRFGLMLAVMQPPAGLEEEFDDWYDTEHLPQRRALPGFLHAARWVCVAGYPRSLAAYDLVSLAALDSPEYRAVAGANSTPWSRRILARTARAGRMRVEAEQVWPGTAGALPRGVNCLLAARYPGAGDVDAFVAAAREAFAALPRLGQLRLFRSAGPDAACWAVAEFRAPPGLQALMDAAGEVAGQGADVFNVYLPYAGR